MKDNIIREKSFDFALNIIELYKQMIANNEYVMSKQLLRSGTSIGANIEEASAAQSKKYFINKVAISSKEARETKYWLRLIQESRIVNCDVEIYIKEIDEIIKNLTSIVKTSKEKL
jgi:four helix bundle protein